MENMKRLLATFVFALLFISMAASFIFSLSTNMVPVRTVICPVVHGDIIQMGETDEDVPDKSRIEILKHFIVSVDCEKTLEPVREDMVTYPFRLAMELAQDIFYPPKTRFV